MKNILVIGSTGQIGSELTMELRKRYGNEHVVAGYIIGAEPKGELLESGPSAIADVTDPEGIAKVQAEHPDVDIFLAAVDDHLNENAYIVPGLGDAGDRIFGTK